MDLLTMINECTEEQIEPLINNVLRQEIANSEEKEILGFGENFNTFTIHKGTINPKTRIRYCCRSGYSYSMKTTDYYYEFARYLKKTNVKDKGHLIKSVEGFINDYFGSVTTTIDKRDTYFEQISSQTAETDEECWVKLDELEIGDLKGKNIAMCTEMAAIAQNLLSLFGIETYYCIGCVDNDSKEEVHCFNVAKAKKAYKLLDYSLPCPVMQDGKVIDWAPFQGNIELEEMEDFLANKVNKTFNSYVYVLTSDGIRKVPNGDTRTYVVGSFSLTDKRGKLK